MCELSVSLSLCALGFTLWITASCFMLALFKKPAMGYEWVRLMQPSWTRSVYERNSTSTLSMCSHVVKTRHFPSTGLQMSFSQCDFESDVHAVITLWNGITLNGYVESFFQIWPQLLLAFWYSRVLFLQWVLAHCYFNSFMLYGKYLRIRSSRVYTNFYHKQ